MKVEASIKNLRIAPRKSRLVVSSVIGMSVEAALVQLGKQTKRASLPVLTLLKSAVANAENNFGLDRKTLFVKTAEVGEGQKLKRWKPKAFGRAGAIIKRSSRVFLVLENREETLKETKPLEKKESKPMRKPLVKKSKKAERAVGQKA